jgi:hypothetical protein
VFACETNQVVGVVDVKMRVDGEVYSLGADRAHGLERAG